MGTRLVAIIATALITVSILLKIVVPQAYRLGIGRHYYRPAYAYWVLLLAGIILALVAVLKAIPRTNSG